MAVVAASLAISLAGCGESSRSLLNTGKELAQRQQHAAAVVKFKAALDKDAGSAEGRLLLGRSLLALNDPGGAIVELNKAHDKQHAPHQVVPLLARAMVLAGESNRLTQQFSHAALDDALAVASLQSSLATAWAALGDRTKTEAAAAAALKAKPDHLPALLLQARLMAGRGELEQARQLVEQLIARPNQVHDALHEPLHELWHLRGEMLLQRDSIGAEASFRKALTIDPAYVPSHLSLVQLRLGADDFSGARSLAAQLKSALPGHPQSQFVDAQIQLHQGEWAQARETVQPLLKGAPNHPGILLLAGAIEVKGGSLLLAQTYLARAVQADPELVPARRDLAYTYLRMEQPKRALEVLAPLLSSRTGLAEAHALAGEAHLQMGDSRAAESSLQRAARLAPDNLRVRTALALATLARGDEAAAFADLQALSALDREAFVDMALVAVRLKRREWDTALRVARNMAAQHPQNAAVKYMLGRVHMARKDLQAARQAFDEVLRIDPRHFEALAAQAALDVEEMKPEQAQRRYEAAIRSEPRNHRARVALADLLASQGASSQQVDAVLMAAVKAAPDEPAARLRLIDRALLAQQFKTALQLAQDANTAIPGDPDLQEALGRTQAAAGDKQQAIHTYKQLAAVEGSNGTPHLRIGQLYASSGDVALAEQHLKKSLDIEPESSATLQALTDLLVLNQRRAEALAIARKVQSQRPNEPAGYLSEAALHLKAGAVDEALATYRQGLERAGECSELAVGLHKALVSSRRDAEADRFGGQWSKSQPDDAAFEYQLALTDLRRDALPQAEERLKQVLRLRPGHAMAMNNLAWVLVARGKPGATDLARKAVDLLPARPALIDTLALALAAEKQFTQALEMQKKAVELAPLDNSLRLNLARIAHQAGERGLARKELAVLQSSGTPPHIRDEVTKLLKAL